MTTKPKSFDKNKILPCHQDTVVDLFLEYLRKNRIPVVFEVFLSYILAALCFIYYLFAYIQGTVFKLSSWCATCSSKPRRIPLTLEVRTRRRRPKNESDAKAYDEQVNKDMLQAADCFFEQLKKNNFAFEENSSDDHAVFADKIVESVRNDISLRRSATNFMMLCNVCCFECSQSDNRYSNKVNELFKILDAVWFDLLRLPPIESSKDCQHSSYPFSISLIVPAFREPGESVANALNQAFQNCKNPGNVQIVVVHADNTCPDLATFVKKKKAVIRNDENMKTEATNCKNEDWAEILIVDYNGKGGRGPCMNAGAAAAKGKILTFLHSDTLLPIDWDDKVAGAFDDKNGITTHACSFQFGVNTSSSGLSGMPYPWGIKAVWFLANFRARLCRNPYGDHVISVPAAYFWYLGGFPEQPIMEDYDLMDLLRQRAAVPELKEQLKILLGSYVYCSPRRWQNFGVVYVTAVNALIVNRYIRGDWLASDIFDYYYRRPFQEKEKSQSSQLTKGKKNM